MTALHVVVTVAAWRNEEERQAFKGNDASRGTRQRGRNRVLSSGLNLFEYTKFVDWWAYTRLPSNTGQGMDGHVHGRMDGWPCAWTSSTCAQTKVSVNTNHAAAAMPWQSTRTTRATPCTCTASALLPHDSKNNKLSLLRLPCGRDMCVCVVGGGRGGARSQRCRSVPDPLSLLPEQAMSALRTAAQAGSRRARQADAPHRQRLCTVTVSGA